MREVVQELDPDVPVFAEATLVDAYRQLTATPRFAAFLMSIFGVLALSLACVGIYGVLAFTVGRQGREIAVRRALGARAQDVASSVVGHGLRMAAIGAAVGGAGAIVAVRLLAGFLFQVPPTDLATFLSAAGLTMGVSALATAVPAVRAARRPPADALSQD